MHLLLGSLLQILGRTEHQHQNSSAAPVTSYRCSTARWLHELFEVQHRSHPQPMPVSPWNAFMRQLFRFFAGMAELQVLMLLLHIAHDVHLHCLHVPPFLVPCSAKYGNSTVAAGGYRCALSAATPQSKLPTHPSLRLSTAQRQAQHSSLVQSSSRLRLLHMRPPARVQCSHTGAVVNRACFLFAFCFVANTSAPWSSSKMIFLLCDCCCFSLIVRSSWRH